MIRFQRSDFISSQKSKFLFWIFILPLAGFLFFKDPIIVLTVYIGIFLLGLILFFILFEKIMQNIFEKSKIQLLDSLILQIRVGNSPQKALTEALYCSSKLEKKLFEPIKYVFNTHFSEDQIHFLFTRDYILELRVILISASRVQSFRDGLKIQFQFKHKSNQVTQQIKAQAIVASVIYLIIFVISYLNLGLNQFPNLMLASFVLFLVGIIVVFKIGGKIRWKI